MRGLRQFATWFLLAALTCLPLTDMAMCEPAPTRAAIADKPHACACCAQAAAAIEKTSGQLRSGDTAICNCAPTTPAQKTAANELAPIAVAAPAPLFIAAPPAPVVARIRAVSLVHSPPGARLRLLCSFRL